MRARQVAPDQPLGVVATERNTEVLGTICTNAEAAGLHPGQKLVDARAICPTLVTRPACPDADAAFLTRLARWAQAISPWVAEEPPDALMIDVTGCTHLAGGEDALIHRIRDECEATGLTVRVALADTPGAAHALAHHAGSGRPAGATRSGDAIDQEARATRARAARRTIARAGPVGSAAVIAPEGRLHAAIDPLPVAALRLQPETCAALSRLGLRRIGDLSCQPRAMLARRFGQTLLDRLDQAFGRVAEPVSPTRPAPHFAVALSLPEPIGREADVMAGLDRLLPALASRLTGAGQTARMVRLQAIRCDHAVQAIEVQLARPAADPARIRPLLALKLDAIDAGPGIERLRLSAPLTERPPVARRGLQTAPSRDDAMADLIGRLCARLGGTAITRWHPADSHLPEKTSQILAAAWSQPAAAGGWSESPPRPLLLWPPEPLRLPPGIGELAVPPTEILWRGQRHALRPCVGPERIAPEWWLDDPAWRSGVRDYWTAITDRGDGLWLFQASGATISGGWFCHGGFA